MSTTRTFLIEHGLISPDALPNAAGEFKATCPECNNPKEKFFINALGRGVKCFHCSFASSWRKFQRRYEPPTPEEIALENFTARCEKVLWDDPGVLGYLKERGLSEETIRAARLGLCDPTCTGPIGLQEEDGYVSTKLIDDRGELRLHDRITIPYLVDGMVQKVRGRVKPGSTSDVKYLDVSGAEAMPYCLKTIDPSKPVLLCEGEFDALRVLQEGIQAVGIPGANTFRPNWVEGIPNLFIALDGDSAGRKGVEKLKAAIDEVRVVEMPEGFDCTDYLNVFGIESFSNLVDNATLFVNGRPQKEDRLAKTIEAWTDWAYSNRELLGPKISWAPMLEKAISGWSKGLFLLGSLPNSGKSCLLVKAAYECARENSDTVSVYLSLDDDLEDAVTRLVALKTGIDFESVRSPLYSFDHPSDASRRDAGSLSLLNSALIELGQMPNLVIRDAKYGRSLDYIRSYFSSLRNRFPDKQLVVFIDSLAKVTADHDSPVDSANQNAWKSYLASELKYLSTLHGMCIVTPADLRKINEGRRPTNDDLRDSSSLAYESNCILLAFNDLNANQQKSRDSILKWHDADGKEFPVLELAITKNKKSQFRGRIFYRFHTATSDFQEFTKLEAEELEAELYAAEEEAKERKPR